MRLLAFLLIGEATWSAYAIAALLPSIAIYPRSVLVLVAARGLVAALEGSGGWWLATRRSVGPVLARWALLASAVLTIFETGFQMAPSDLWPWYRWYFVCGYWLYAGAAGGYLYARRNKFEG